MNENSQKLEVLRRGLRVHRPDNMSPATLSRIVLSFQTPNGTLEIPLSEIDASGRVGQVRQPRHFFKCPNCSARIERTGDVVADHHAAMRHKVEECTGRASAEDQNRQLREEFEEQQRRAIAQGKTSRLPAVLSGLFRRR